MCAEPRRFLFTFLLLAGLAGCQSTNLPDLPLAQDVDLERFSGDWFVLGGVLTPFEDDAHDAIERYRYVAPDVVETTFEFRRGGPDGELARFTPNARVRPGTGNAVWGMQFVWPLRMDYRIVRVDGDYDLTIVGRRTRDFVWVMARSPVIEAAAWTEIVDFLVAIGYEREDIRRVPQSAAADWRPE
jgi:apolipoprotein D and lipocalin family protein